jgi:4a-hydroxytetrahydrobiopterin dehydratase
MTIALKDRHCLPLPGHHALNATEIDALLDQVQHWSCVGGFITKTFRFPDFQATMAFVNALAAICEREDHHPELKVTYGECTVRFNTHDVNGISVNDFICAAQADALVSAA